MSWHYNKFYSYRRSFYRSNFYYSEKELDFTNENFDYNQFLLQEFFNADIETRKKISNYYIDKFGERSFAYLKRKFSEWANGNYHLTDLMSERILSLMPLFLNSEARHKLGIHQFMSTIKKVVKSYQGAQNHRYTGTKHIYNTQDILEIFENEYNEIQSFSYESLNIYGHKTDMLTDNELLEAMEISKYILEVKLQSFYDQIERDFQVFLPFIHKLKIGTFESSFKINDFNIVVNLEKLDSTKIRIPKFKIVEIEVKSDFKKYSDKYLAYELFDISRKTKEKFAKSFLNKNDLTLFLNHYNELSNKDSEVSFDSKFIAGSGELKIKAKLVPSKMLKISILYSVIRLTIYIIIIVSLIALSIRKEAYILILFGGFFVGTFAYTLISIEIKKIQTLNKKFKTHGK